MNRKAMIVVFSIQIIILSLFPLIGSIEAEGADGSFSGGSGTALDPFRILNVTELQWMGNTSNLDKHFILVNDINATEIKSWNSGAGFVPIGNNANRFIGSLDGKGYEITGLFINRLNTYYQGLFGFVGTGGVVKNVNLIDNVVSGNGYVSGLVGKNEGTVSNCYATGNVSGTGSVGGLVGENDYGKVSNCSFIGNVSGGYWEIGGLVGSNSGMVYNCYSTVNVSGFENVGGLVGRNEGTVSNCYSTGNESGTRDFIGGLVGYNYYGNVSNCSFIGDVNKIGLYSGVLVGYNFYGTVSNSHYNVEKVRIDGEHHLTYGGLYDSQYQDWISSGKTLNIIDYSATIVPSCGYYYISTVLGFRDLLGFADVSSYKFRLGADIDLKNAKGLYIPYFSASDFDGNNHTISNLHINMSFGKFLGLFGYITSSATVHNVNIVEANVDGYFSIGGLVGANDGTLSNCYASGNVNGFEGVGGLVGANDGTLSNCYTSGNVSGSEGYVGGLMGENNKGTVSNCYASGDVNGNYGVGGLVGRIYQGTVSICYSTGNVSGFENVGGLVGANDGTLSNCSTSGNVNGYEGVGGLVGRNVGIVSNCSATGNVNGSGYYVGGLIGENNVGTVSNCSATGNVNGSRYYVGGLIGENNVGTVSNCSASGDVNGYERVGGLVGENYYGTVTNCSAIGSVSGSVKVGSFVGSNPKGTVTNCYATGSVSGDYYVGGLAGENSGTVTNCYATGTVSGIGYYGYVGGLVGYNQRGTLSNCYAIGSVSGSEGYVGGLMGENIKGTVSNCYASGDVNGSYGVGGLVGRNYQGTVSICYSTGNVRGTEGSIGGLIGHNYGTITICHAIGNVSGTKYYVGGLVGENSGTISNSYATGDVIRTSGIDTDFGGFVGFNYRSKILNCYSLGRVIYTDETDPTDKGFTGSVDTGSGYEMKGNFWDTQTSGQTSTKGNATGKSTTEMMALKTFEEAGWDIVHVRDHVDEIWYMDEGYDYPKLGWEYYRDLLSPVAATGPDKTVFMGGTVFFNGSMSSDNIGIVSYTWTFTDGAPIILSGKFRSYRFDNAGVFVVMLNVTDAAGNWDTDTMAVTVMDTQEPFCNAGPDQFINMGDTAHFNASLSTDNVGIVNYTWTFTDGAPFTLSGILRSHKFDNAGVFVVTLNVSDAIGKSAVDTMTVTVWDTEPPIAIAGKDIVIDERQKVTFDAGSSSDNVGIINYSWRFSWYERDDLITITLYGSQVEYQFNDPGLFIVRLAIFDAQYNLATTTVNVTVRDITSPIAVAGPDQRVAVGSAVILDGSWSGDNVGIVRYSWKFIFDGSERTMDGVGFVFVFDKAGTYEIELTVYDEYDHTGKDVVIIRVVDTGIVKGTVFDSKGNPVEGAKVAVRTSNGEINTATTGANGSFSLVVFHGNFSWSISKEGYISISGGSSVKPMEVLELELSDRPLMELQKEQSRSYLLCILVIISVISMIGAITFLLFKKRTDDKEE